MLMLSFYSTISSRSFNTSFYFYFFIFFIFMNSPFWSIKLIKKFRSIVDLMNLGVILWWLNMSWMKFLTCEETLDLVLSKMIHVNLLKPSTIVRKYLWPRMEVLAMGPYISKCNNSYLEEAIKVLNKVVFYV